MREDYNENSIVYLLHRLPLSNARSIGHVEENSVFWMSCRVWILTESQNTLLFLLALQRSDLIRIHAITAYTHWADINDNALIVYFDPHERVLFLF